MSILQEHVREFRDGRDVGDAAAEVFLDAMISETNEDVLAEVLRAWDEKGIADDEIYSIARIMRERCTTVATKHETFVDIVGTGGGRNKAFNISTAAAFVVAGAGVAVAKHGNKAATSNSGSADVLSSLGVETAGDAEMAARCLNEIGICFMFAPNFHRLSPTLAKVRRGLGFPTIFNCVGPLCNPANAPHRLIGVWKEELVLKMARALSRLGTGKSWIVHGFDGVDEISLSGPTIVAEVDEGSVRRFEISLQDFGFKGGIPSGPKAASAEQSANMIREILRGQRRDTPPEWIVLSNAAAAMYIAGAAETLRDAYEKAIESIRSGSAEQKMLRLADLTKR
ncbi:MAG: anthranilate phosphoribosyltransferase [Acidobacteriota bacterium]